MPIKNPTPEYRQQQNIYNHERIMRIAEIGRSIVKYNYHGLVIKAVPTSQALTEFNTVIVSYDKDSNVTLIATGGLFESVEQCIDDGKNIIDELKLKRSKRNEKGN